MSMPDPWEYPWFAAWDLAFHAIPWAHLDPAFAKYQLLVLLREWFQHPNGAIPAYEWSFDDVNPPVHALAALRVFVIDGSTDRDFLARVFNKLLLNFTWWINRLDPDGNNLFGGGFLGLDNISPIDRSHLPPGVTLDQADGTAWMAYYSIAMLAIAVTLAQQDAAYEDMVVKFLEQTVQIMDALEDSGSYDEADGFFYDRLTAGGVTESIRVRTLVGIIPALPAISLPLRDSDRILRLRKRFARRMEQAGRHQLLDWHIRGEGDSRQVLLSVVEPERLAKVYAALFDESEFLSPHGLRSLSRSGTPSRTPCRGCPDATIDYQPAESLTADVRGQLQLARAGLVPDQLPGDQGVAAVRPVLRQRVHRRVPDRVGPEVQPPAGGGRPGGSTGQHLAARPGRAPPGERRPTGCSAPTRSGRTT